MNKQYLTDLIERVLWTAAEAGIAYALVSIQGANDWWVIPVATCLAAIKGFVAKKIGDSNSAATLPSGG